MLLLLTTTGGHNTSSKQFHFFSWVYCCYLTDETPGIYGCLQFSYCTYCLLLPLLGFTYSFWLVFRQTFNGLSLQLDLPSLLKMVRRGPHVQLQSSIQLVEGTFIHSKL